MEGLHNYWVQTVKSVKLPHCDHGKAEKPKEDPRYTPDKPGPDVGPFTFGRRGELRRPRFHKLEDLKAASGFQLPSILVPDTTTTTATITEASRTDSSKLYTPTEYYFSDWVENDLNYAKPMVIVWDNYIYVHRLI